MGKRLGKQEPHISLYLLTLLSLQLQLSLSYLLGGIVQHIIPALLFFPASWRLPARPTLPREIGWPAVRVCPLRYTFDESRGIRGKAGSDASSIWE